jgi:RHS repeat-associated protein
MHHDQQGSTRLLTGSTGTVTGKCTYGAYGSPTCEGATTTPLGYDAQYASSDTGLIYMRARTYDPATAQFLTVDPLGELTRAPYNYTGDNPLNHADPKGLTSIWEESGPCSFPCVPPLVSKGVEESFESAQRGVESVWNEVDEQEGSNPDEGTQGLKEHESAECNAESIASGHAFDKHVEEFPGISTPKEFQERIEEVIENPTASKELGGGRTAYYDEPTNTLVIEDPSNPDQGTAFKPEEGIDYYNKL